MGGARRSVLLLPKFSSFLKLKKISRAAWMSNEMTSARSNHLRMSGNSAALDWKDSYWAMPKWWNDTRNRYG